MPSLSWLFLLVVHLVGTGVSALQTGCEFPESWRGTWFQSGVRQPIYITPTEVTTKGNCTTSRDQKYVLHDAKRNRYVCVVFYQKHVNVIQYKESFVDVRPSGGRASGGRPDLHSLCRYVNGDLPLYSMFRVHYRPIGCPLRGPYTFSYSRGHVTQQRCSWPPSRLERCNIASRMLFRYRACVDVASSEEAVEEVECVGMWKEGSARYLVTRRFVPGIVSHEDAFRCFIYERAAPQESTLEYRLAESGEATCSGLFTTRDGTRRMELVPAGSYNKCQFPPWTTVHRHWHSLDRLTGYSFNWKNTTLTVTTSDNETTMDCAELIDVNHRQTRLIVRSTTGCYGGFQCVSFFRRDDHVMEAKFGAVVQGLDEACSVDSFPDTSTNYHTMISSSLHHVPCPHLGRYSVTGVSYEPKSEDRDARDLVSPFSSLHMGCSSQDTLVLSGSLGIPPRAFSCHGSWQENGTFFLVVTPDGRAGEAGAGSARHVCFVYTVSPQGLRFSTVSSTCQRTARPGVEGQLAFNATVKAECLTSSAGPATSLVSSGVMLLAMLTLRLAVDR